MSAPERGHTYEKTDAQTQPGLNREWFSAHAHAHTKQKRLREARKQASLPLRSTLHEVGKRMKEGMEKVDQPNHLQPKKKVVLPPPVLYAHLKPVITDRAGARWNLDGIDMTPPSRMTSTERARPARGLVPSIALVRLVLSVARESSVGDVNWRSNAHGPLPCAEHHCLQIR